MDSWTFSRISILKIRISCFLGCELQHDNRNYLYLKKKKRIVKSIILYVLNWNNIQYQVNDQSFPKYFNSSRRTYLCKWASWWNTRECANVWEGKKNATNVSKKIKPILTRTNVIKCSCFKKKKKLHNEPPMMDVAPWVNIWKTESILY